MWGWLVGGYTGVLVALTGFAGFVASGVDCSKKRADAYKVLKLVLMSVTGAGGVFAVLVRLHEAGLV
ncbi:hypothetical protein [Lentzea albida]|uniref:Uncharacterized protein n=1 Tax=Lentzea albida TaxID=65499 RepID=A0A1H9LBH8_9PSEU|nr:hypothetical protein [Lentzea albida]SER08505.1 hypothetical protein SAMN04488000_10640 [Lentzea albida]